MTTSSIDVDRPTPSAQLDGVAEDTLAPAAGILHGLMVSTGMWVIALIAYWYRLHS